MERIKFLLFPLVATGTNGLLPGSYQINRTLGPWHLRLADESFDPVGKGPRSDRTSREDGENSDLTDRFKYKVHALMGSYDPAEGVVDDERQEGNILNAMMTFPSRFTFTVVGKTLGVEELQNEYIDRIKALVYDTTGDDGISCEVTPRGKNFLRVEVNASVQSVGMINSIYDELDAMNQTVMRF
mmetsp:Transcript_18934/g.35320  ORF Transcript_18934/g.35320 Transcript_18934/m.35320 type:complete len:185 (-) Transcript_18934:1147-1701(-)